MEGTQDFKSSICVIYGSIVFIRVPSVSHPRLKNRYHARWPNRCKDYKSQSLLREILTKASLRYLDASFCGPFFPDRCADGPTRDRCERSGHGVGSVTPPTTCDGRVCAKWNDRGTSRGARLADDFSPGRGGRLSRGNSGCIGIRSCGGLGNFCFPAGFPCCPCYSSIRRRCRSACAR
jgi:hypothetical protein